METSFERIPVNANEMGLDKLPIVGNNQTV
jgi:hypothetical protein